MPKMGQNGVAGVALRRRPRGAAHVATRRVAQHSVLIAATLLLLGPPPLVMALDTVECFDLGATDVELYAGAVELGRGDGQVTQEFVLGLGLTEALSAYAGVPIAAGRNLATAESELHFGVFGTPVTRGRWALDLLFDACAGGDGWSELTIAPGIEVNYDRFDANDEGGWGLFFQGQVAVHPEFCEDSVLVGPGSGTASDARLALHSDLALGVRRRIGAAHEVLLRIDAALPLRSTLDRGGALESAVVGYNRELGETLELITEGSWRLARGSSPATFSFLIGCIASLPSP